MAKLSKIAALSATKIPPTPEKVYDKMHPCLLRLHYTDPREPATLIVQWKKCRYIGGECELSPVDAEQSLRIDGVFDGVDPTLDNMLSDLMNYLGKRSVEAWKPNLPPPEPPPDGGVTPVPVL